ncbi:MAG: insulinase family protein, partial [Pyrinomonadaceae bacterium]|nr:insulinase family protein [Pyrinomonadaceae bacterium]
MSLRFRVLAATLSLSLIATSALAQGSSTSRSQTSSSNNANSPSLSANILPRLSIEQFTLPNGLRVVMSRDSSVPVVAVALHYDVGSRNERAGRTGFAHLFEHMMFQGSENVGKNKYGEFVANAGGGSNATTNTERTYYYATLPANQLPLALWLESDRMRSLKVTQENLSNQIKVVQEEKRFRIDNQPYVGSNLRLSELVFGNFANAHSVIGSMEDLDAATLEDVQQFFKTYYTPNNAVLAIAGDFDPKGARSLVEKYFGTIPRGATPPALDVNETANVAKRTDTILDPLAQTPLFRIGWKIPPSRTPDFYALTIATRILFGGESSRLYQRLVKTDESALVISGNIDERRGPSAVVAAALPKPGKDAAQVKQTIFDEIHRFATEGPTADEMERARNTILNGTVRLRQSAQTVADRLAEFTLFYGDPTLVNTELDRYLSVTPERVKAAVARYLDTDNRVVLDVVPARGANRPAGSNLPSGDARQPGAPAPQVPPQQPVRPDSPTRPANPDRPADQQQRPAQP